LPLLSDLVSGLLLLTEASLWLVLLGGAALLARGALWAARQPPLRLAPSVSPPTFPRVTVQLPLRNERAVVDQLLRHTAALDWPRERLEIQVLDDSDDETRDVVDAGVDALRARGYAIQALRRADRRGYKAGALQAALPQATGELLLLLDADSKPEPDLLHHLAAALLARDDLGFVQARWSFGNEHTSLLTRVQALLLDGWYALELARLSAQGQPVQLTGTAALVRRSALEAAGGWLRDGGAASVTEDLDLSARLMARGFHGRTLPEVAVETELPDTVAAWRAQQVRWVRGAGEVLRAAGPPGAAAGLLGPLLRHIRQPLFTAWLLLFPLRAVGLTPSPLPWAWPLVFPLLLLAAAAYYAAARRRLGRSLIEAAALSPLVVTLQLGLAPALAAGLLRGLLAKEPGEFVRTPKRGDGSRPPYRPPRAPEGALEVLLGAAYAALAIRAALAGEPCAASALAAFPALGLLWIGAGSLRAAR
jgi:cellulose synthase/poly-beta-1,6-N-acetylglucosamine synthase-like glycosyltransferase